MKTLFSSSLRVKKKKIFQPVMMIIFLPPPPKKKKLGKDGVGGCTTM
jgi:hypothetical protein